MSTSPLAAPPLPPQPRPGAHVLLMLGFIALYVLLDRVSHVHPMRGTQITAWNPQFALAVALLVRRPGWWPVVAAAVAAATVARTPSALSGSDAVIATALALGYGGIALAMRLRMGPSPQLGTRSGCLGFLALAGGGAALSSSLYVGALALTDSLEAARLGTGFLRAWVGDVVSLVVTLPLLFGLLDPDRRARASAMLRSTEWWLVAVGAGFAAMLVFARPQEEQFKFFYLLFLPVAWGAARFGHVGAVASAALVQVLLMVAVQSDAYVPLTVFELHMLLAVLGATGLLLGATVDEREQAEQALRESLHAAAAADMAAALAHELNQPLTALRTYARAAHLLAEQSGVAAGTVSAGEPGSTAAGSPAGAAAGSLTEVTGKLVAEVTRAGAVVRRLRDFFRQGGTELMPVDLAPLLREVADDHAVRAEAAGVEVQVVAPATLPLLLLDRVQIEVVLRNLVANAVEAAGQWPHGQVQLAAQLQAAVITVSVTDNGPGIAAADLPTVFESRRSSKPGGMGVGLSISRSIIEAHGGRLWAEPGPGGRFFFSLPVEGIDHA